MRGTQIFVEGNLLFTLPDNPEPDFVRTARHWIGMAVLEKYADNFANRKLETPFGVMVEFKRVEQ